MAEVLQLDALNVKLTTPTSFLLVGPSGAGKTTLLQNLMEYSDILFADDSFMQHVIIFYQARNSMTAMEAILRRNRKVKRVEFIRQCPTADLVLEKIEPYMDIGGSALIIDDWGASLPKDLDRLFTVDARHCKSTVFLLMQDLFRNKDHLRYINRNVKHLICFQNPRDIRQFYTLTQQLTPGKRFLREVYDYILNSGDPYKYLWCDLSARTHPMLKFKSDVTPPEWPMIIFLEKEKKF